MGVWQVRENVCNTMRQEPQTFDTFREALSSVMSRLSIPLERWMEAGPLLRHTLSQRKFTNYFN